MHGPKHYGFTLIEMAIALVIIGLVVGGVLVGRDLIAAAGIRATISQIEKYQTAANTFQEKYGMLPGDINVITSSQFGFTPRVSSIYPGYGDADGQLIGMRNTCTGSQDCKAALTVANGETGMFWVDLTTANGLNVNLIEGSFSSAKASGALLGSGAIQGVTLDKYLPAAKMGKGNYICVWSGGYLYGAISAPRGDGLNYFGLIAAINIGSSKAYAASAMGLTVREAYDIDQKIDDGLPQVGRVMAMYPGTKRWASGGPTDANGETIEGDNVSGAPLTSNDVTTTSPSATTCYDNGGLGGVEHYSISQSNGSSVNCALSVRFQ